ncbi:valyl-tRNA synthetase [Mycoplasma haemofelis Ohio2]|uniref:Valine--tRNA ligase n=1 Tax=Mycoplasma haemofelis (strain Ohio2) TaxID=859194 RepID=F6FFX1_MYCHI|nr:valyl-tRNA synthetase [Mycoplasma haemofelis Ohio2]
MNYFSTLLPPPNLTGILHLGHLWNALLQDFLIRHYKSQGIPTYWGYGMDHAGISLQVKVESELKKGGLRKGDLTKEEFSKRLWAWKDIHAERIRSQYRKLNLLLPLEEEHFTLSSESQSFVVEVFKKLYRDGLIYRDERLVNWDPLLRTAISDAEVLYKQENSKLYYIKYFFEDSDSEYISIATTRPETIFADVAIFVNPEDERYLPYVGRKVRIPLIGKAIPILTDPSIDKDFGTGAMKCTPAHDFADYELGKKHSLDIVKAYDTEGIMLSETYEGLNKEEVKKRLVKDLGELVEVSDYVTNITYSDRSGAKVEPMLSKQWFLKSSQLAKRALELWEHSNLKITNPSRLRRYLQDMEDWCISRQLEWGIKIPVFLKGDEHSLEFFEGSDPSEDVLDTWFSSSLWPQIVFKGGEMSPISLLVSGKDILFFWVSRMLFMGTYLDNHFPFQNIYLHGLVLDSKNRKMSKSLNNGIDPIELSEEFGLDVVRLFFLANTHPESNIAFSKNKLEKHSKFLHKLRNASSFIKAQNPSTSAFRVEDLNILELWILKEFVSLRDSLGSLYESLSFSFIAENISSFVWDSFCNKYLELYKLMNKGEIANTEGFLLFMWNEILKILWPLIPNFSEQSYLDLNGSALSHQKRELGEGISLPTDIGWFLEYFNTYISIRKKLEIPWNAPLKVRIVIPNESWKEANSPLLPYLKIFNHELVDLSMEASKDVVLIFSVGDIFVELFLEEEKVLRYREHIQEVKKKLISELEFLNRRLNTGDFKNMAPKELVHEVQEKIERYQKELDFYTSVYG